MTIISSTLFASFLISHFACYALGATTNLLTGEVLNSVWLETGYVSLNDYEWHHVHTVTNEFTNPLVFLSLPEIDGETFEDGYPTCTRLKDISVDSSGEVSFSAKIYLTNDSFCSKTWYTPEHIVPDVPVGWMVIEQGMYSVGGHYFFVFSTSMTRPVVSVLDLNSPNLINTPYPSGCVGMTTNCRFPNSIDPNNLGVTTQIQSLVNDRFLMVRGQRLRRQDVTLTLNPHDSFDPSYYVITAAELVGVMVYETGVKISCAEGIALETFKAYTTSVKVQFNLQHVYIKQNPGVYGMLASLASLTDMTGVRMFDQQNGSFSLITQEDQCFTEQTEHTTRELMTAIVVGRTMESFSNYCFEQPTPLPTLVPTRQPSSTPTRVPTRQPSSTPTLVPTRQPSSIPTRVPTRQPTFSPTFVPTRQPSSTPTLIPTRQPSAIPTRVPTRQPTSSPTFVPTRQPSSAPTLIPTRQPSATPTHVPTRQPSASPTSVPSSSPTSVPTSQPTSQPTSSPTLIPTWIPTAFPTLLPTSNTIHDDSECGECTSSQDVFLKNGSYLQLSLYDQFGDSWGVNKTLSYWISFENGVQTNTIEVGLSCNCSYKTSAIFPIRPEEDNFFHFQLDTPEGFFNPFEVLWTVLIVHDGKAAERYYGTVNSTMVFAFEYKLEKFKILAWENMLMVPDTCREECLDTVHGSFLTYSQFIEEFTTSGSVADGDEAPSTSGDDSVAYLLSSWYITDVLSANQLYSFGNSICGFDDDGNSCPMCLNNGVYILRTLGNCFNATSSDVNFEFCGTQFDRDVQVQFKIDDGKCKVQEVFDSIELCDGTLSDSLYSDGKTKSPISALFITLASLASAAVTIGAIKMYSSYILPFF